MAVRSKLRSILSSLLPLADELKSSSFKAIAKVGLRLSDCACVSTRCACGTGAIREASPLAIPGGLPRPGISRTHSADLDYAYLLVVDRPGPDERKFVTTPCVGEVFHFDLDGTVIAGRYIEVDPPHRMLLRWDRHGIDEITLTPTFIEITLTSTSGGTSVWVEFSGLSGEDADLYPKLLARHLDRIATFLASSEPTHGN